MVINLLAGSCNWIYEYVKWWRVREINSKWMSSWSNANPAERTSKTRFLSWEVWNVTWIYTTAVTRFVLVDWLTNPRKGSYTICCIYFQERGLVFKLTSILPATSFDYFYYFSDQTGDFYLFIFFFKCNYKIFEL